MTPAPKLETLKNRFEEIFASNPAVCQRKIDIAALFPPQRTEKAFGDDIDNILRENDALRLLAETHRSIAMFFCVGFHPDVEKRLAFVDPFIDAMKESVKNKTYDEGFKIMVAHCQKLRELLYEAMYEGPYDEDKADGDPEIKDAVIAFQDFFFSVIEQQCPDVGVEDEDTANAIREHMDKQEVVVVNKKDVAKVERKLQEMAKQHGELVLWQHQPIDQDHEAFRFAFFPKKAC